MDEDGKRRGVTRTHIEMETLEKNSTGDIEARRWGLGKWGNDVSEAVGIRSHEKSF